MTSTNYEALHHIIQFILLLAASKM